nr:uncharacterized protein LOC111415921 isoform X2 [Onthophagus taurus]
MDEKEKMENRGFQRDAETGVELKESFSMEKKPSNGVTTDAMVQPSTSCKPEVCQAARMRFSLPEMATGSPWHRNKTIFLVTFLVALGIWIVIYVTLSQLKLL